MESRNYIRISIALLLLGVVFCPLQSVSGAEYVIGTEDVLAIRFWQDPNLNAEVRVNLDGKISLDIVGQVQAAGRTTEQLQSDIVRLISSLNRNISQATVRVIEYHYNHVYVIGQVATPGKRAYEVIPDLFTIIMESGGLAEAGDLSRVTIIRGGDDAGEVIEVDVSKAIANGTVDQLPRLKRGDTIEVGRAPGQLMAGELARTSEAKNLFYVVGAVTTPGPVSYEQNIDVLEAIALAGGPTASADIKKTQLVIKDGNFGQAVKINLAKYAQTGRPARYIMQKEDLIIIPTRQGGFFETTVGRVATLLTAISTAYLVVDQITGP